MSFRQQPVAHVTVGFFWILATVGFFISDSLLLLFGILFTRVCIRGRCIASSAAAWKRGKLVSYAFLLFWSGAASGAGRALQLGSV